MEGWHGRRDRWVYAEDGGGGFQRQPDGGWVQTARNIPGASVYSETARTDDYVELYERDLRLLVRLFPDHFEYRREGEASFAPMYRGRWEC